MANRKSPKPFLLIDENARRQIIAQIRELPADGTMKVTIAGAKDKSTRQRGLQWIWYEDVLYSGIGGFAEQSKELIHQSAKARFCLPIQIRDDDNFSDMWLTFYNRWHLKAVWEVKFAWFVDNVVSTEALNQAQMAEFLTEFQNYYAFERGVNLTDPEERGWKNLLRYEEVIHG